jgi:hypothetical protein
MTQNGVVGDIYDVKKAVNPFYMETDTTLPWKDVPVNTIIHARFHNITANNVVSVNGGQYGYFVYNITLISAMVNGLEPVPHLVPGDYDLNVPYSAWVYSLQRYVPRVKLPKDNKVYQAEIKLKKNTRMGVDMISVKIDYADQDQKRK